MIDAIIKEIAGKNQYCKKFAELDKLAQYSLISAALRTNSIEVNAVATDIIIDRKLLADCVDLIAFSKTDNEFVMTITSFFKQFRHSISEKMQDLIDEYNEQIEANNNEPPRPQSDFT